MNLTPGGGYKLYKHTYRRKLVTSVKYIANYTVPCGILPKYQTLQMFNVQRPS